jgi:hypothetical protein
LTEDNNNEVGPNQAAEATDPKILTFKKFQKKDKPWPAAAPPANDLTVTAKDPGERRILVTTVHGDVVVDGYLGLSQTFLAIGDASGAIHWAAGPEMWLYACDVTDNPKYADAELEYELVPDDEDNTEG